MPFFDVLRRAKVPRMKELRGFLGTPVRNTLAAALFTSLAAGCSSDSNTDKTQNSVGSDGGGSDAGPKSRMSASALAELHDKGVDKYIGVAKPVSHTAGTTAGQEVYEFDPADGPKCLWGANFHAVVRDKGSDNLLIYLEGGGACWSSLCSANETASSAIAPVGLLNDGAASTSVVADWNVVYVPYCDGSVFSGDNDFVDMTTMGHVGQTRYHHGLRNLTAAVDLAKSLYPDAKRILLAGSSAGGYGTLTGTGVVRIEFPETDLQVFNDSGLGLSNQMDLTNYNQIKAEWKFDQFIPDSCTECQSGQQTAIIGWGFKNDKTLKASAFSSYGDSVIAGFFLKLAAPDFKALLLEKTGEVHDAYPDRFERFFIEGTQHTSLIAGFDSTKVGNYTIADHTRAMVEGSSDWKDTLENGGM